MKLFTRHMPMRKFLVIVFIFNLFCLFVPHIVQANDYNKAVVGHVISETIKGTNMDHQKLLEAEMSKMAHTFTLQLVNVLQQHLPYIMDSVMTQLRLDLDKKHKCLLLKDSKIGDKECQDKKTHQ